ncbi:protein O-glucosyltransferase 2-like [Argiope bruennichi]|uniref:Protein O-glucosyltransferase 2 like protein n=1 Tax=Argiope bruennichi TaxID=94029 RepID=A0A8T0EJG8_ARGBR|nr:protein O-glucosyltransferase 2-like [Argiope bruennichi]KAF8773671.1 Protein O-glucosyltransferase 2 like protein [Argiope bruennichi]
MPYKQCSILQRELICFAVIFLTHVYCKDVEKNAIPTISLKNSKVYGPGLSANFTVPVRYFFIELLDTEHRSFSSSPESLNIQVSGLKEKCRIWYQLLQIKEGLFIARYRLYETCVGVQIDIVYENQFVADAPYVIEGLIFQEQCYCPKPINEWLSNLNCPSSYTQINDDLKLFPEIDMRSSIEDALQRFNHPGSYSICHYSVISNQVYRKCFGQYVGFSMFMDEILLSLTRKMYLPDLELIANLGDWPLEQRSAAEKPIPIFSWCGSKSTKDIVMPTYDVTEATLEMMGRVMVDILSVMGNSGPSWEQKIPKAFWRGRDSRQERLDLIKLAREYPDLINASLTNFFFFRKEEAEYGPKSEYISFFDFFKYRYQINIDGTVAAYRLPYLLAGGSLVLKQDSDFYEHFYNDLQPMVHYVPFNRNLSNLVDKLQWAIDHDNEAQTIAENAQNFALSNLMPKDILCYYAVLFNEYSKRLKSESIIHDNMEHIKQPVQKSCLCPDENKLQAKFSREEL